MNDFDRAARYTVKTEPEETKRWLFPRVPASLRIKTMAHVASEFAQLTECEAVWREALEGIMMKVSPFAEEIRQEGRIEIARKYALKVLESRFPGQIPSAVVERIKAETDLSVLDGWFSLVSTASLETITSAIK